MRPYSPGGALNALASARRAGPPTPSAHRLRPGLPGYLILFAPPAFAPQRQPRPRGLPSPSAFFPISAHSTATPGIPSSPAALEPGSSGPVPGLSPGLRGLACRAACAPFTPNESGQRSPPTCYRGCWHVVSRGFFCRYSHSSSLPKAVYGPRAFLPHAASLRQACAHCAKFPTAASRRSLGRISVPMWPAGLSARLPVVSTVGRHPAVCLMGRDPIPSRLGFARRAMRPCGFVRY